MAAQTINMGIVREAAAGRFAFWNVQTPPLTDRVSQCDSKSAKLFVRVASATGIRRVVSLLGRLAARFRMPEVALSLARASASRNPSPSDHWQLARCLLSGESHGIAIEGSNQSQKELLKSLGIASQSKDPRVRPAATIALADALYRCGQYPEALALAERTLSTTPKEPRLLRIEANCLIACARFTEGRAVYDHMLALDAANGELKRKVALLAPFLREQAVRQTASARQSEASLLIGIGGGIGDMLHVAPAIRNIVRRSGERVDVLILADHAGAEFLMRNSEYVNRVWIPSLEVLDRQYRTVLLTHSFGPMRFPFTADRILASRQWRTFRPGLLNETLFNLEAAKQLLGIPWDDEDTEGYFIGDLAYCRPAEALVGFHAGSKKGRWLSKRWPRFPELASRLTARGIRVASFGTADEYVEGTENRTGGTVEEMCRSMLDCTHFISNDSGPMHIANALGIPVLAIFAPTDALTHLPLRRTTVALSLVKRCSPCEVKDHRYFASGLCRCVGEISATEVEEKLMTIFRVDTSTREIAASGAERGITQGTFT
jgi:tetratricopeptide (TPR) repeat protein